MKILFVCLGNICRSPTAEAVFKKKLSVLNINAEIDSAGTAGYHVGEGSDPRSIHHAEARGYSMTHKARQFTTNDFEKFDIIYVMDDSNYRDVLRLAETPEQRAKVKKISALLQSTRFNHVPDPYHGDSKGFELVVDLAEEAFEHFIRGHYSDAGLKKEESF